MRKSRNGWFINFFLIATLILWGITFAAHYKNWYKVESEALKIVSGFYYREIPFSEVDTISYVNRIPEMERVQGFSWLMHEKGIFKDSLSGKKMLVLVDDLQQQKIKLVYQDSLKIYLNFKDSLETKNIFKLLSNRKLPDIEKNK